MTIDVECTFNSAENALGLKQASVIINDEDEDKIMADLEKQKGSQSPSNKWSIITENIWNAWNQTTDNKLA